MREESSFLQFLGLTGTLGCIKKKEVAGYVKPKISGGGAGLKSVCGKQASSVEGGAADWDLVGWV